MSHSVVLLELLYSGKFSHGAKFADRSASVKIKIAASAISIAPHVWAPQKLKPRKFIWKPSEAIPRNFSPAKISRYMLYTAS